MLITKIQTVEMKKLKRDTRREIIKQEKLARDKVHTLPLRNVIRLSRMPFDALFSTEFNMICIYEKESKNKMNLLSCPDSFHYQISHLASLYTSNAWLK